MGLEPRKTTFFKGIKEILFKSSTKMYATCAFRLLFIDRTFVYFSTEMAQRKILFITNRIPYPLKDGGNLAMNAMIEGYHRSGWQVYLLSMNTTRHHIPHEQLKQLFT